jgi:hypothetical protein
MSSLETCLANEREPQVFFISIYDGDVITPSPKQKACHWQENSVIEPALGHLPVFQARRNQAT